MGASPAAAPAPQVGWLLVVLGTQHHRGEGSLVQGNDDASWCRRNWNSPSLGALVAQWCSTLSDPVDYAHQAPLSIGFSRPESWSGLPFPSPGDLPDPEIKPGSPTLQAESLLSESLGKPPVLEGLTN